MAKLEIRHLDLNDNSFVVVKKRGPIEGGPDVIELTLSDYSNFKHTIHFDKSTAIRLAKTLRTEINKIEEV